LAKNKELSTAERILTLLDDITLDLDLIGEYISEILPRMRYRRLKYVVEVAEDRVENEYTREDHLAELQRISKG
jgi:hypothetical protein